MVRSRNFANVSYSIYIVSILIKQPIGASRECLIYSACDTLATKHQKNLVADANLAKKRYKWS